MLRPLVFLALGLLAFGCAPGGLPGSAGSSIASARTPQELVRAYYGAIDARDYRAAYAAWGREGAASGQSFEEFKDGFAETARVAMEVIGPVQTEGAAGSTYATVPVVVRIDRKDGRRQNYSGACVVKRVNDRDGATAEQLRWHLESADIGEIR